MVELQDCAYDDSDVYLDGGLGSGLMPRFEEMQEKTAESSIETDAAGKSGKNSHRSKSNAKHKRQLSQRNMNAKQGTMQAPGTVISSKHTNSLAMTSEETMHLNGGAGGRQSNFGRTP